MEIIQIIILTAYSIFAVYDQLNLNFVYSPIASGVITGFVLGDVGTGLTVGATLQLMMLGIASYGGSSVPDYLTGSIIGTAFAITSGQGIEIGLAIAVPVGLLMVQLDILGRFGATYFQHMSEKAAEREDYKKVALSNILGFIPWGLSRGLPVFIVLLLGQGAVEYILSVSPEWLINGLKVAGGILPAVGISMLLKYMPLKKFWMYAVLGFTLVSYLSMPMLGVALIGVFFAALQFTRKESIPVEGVANTEEGGRIEDDE